jgi:pimeloyl-ACP methyl ester carboxylesterase
MLLTDMRADAIAGGPFLRVDGRVVRPALAGPGWFAFALPAMPAEVRLCAARFRPADLRRADRGTGQDVRQLGFAVTWLRLVDSAGVRTLRPGDAVFGPGFHPAEAGLRWSDGDGVLSPVLFAGMAGPAMLLVAGFGAEGPGAGLPSHRAVFLGGDSWPKDEHAARHLRRVIHPMLAEDALSQADLNGDGPHMRDIAARVAGLAAAVGRDAGRTVLFGRSSGGRIATLFARRHGAAAVVCLGYPFRAPGGPDEPERHAHLADLRVPTLIVQGRDDPYGGEVLARACARSPFIALHMVEGGHEFGMDEAAWQAVGRRVQLFLAEHAGAG